MTTEELERDLEMLAAPREADELLRMAIRERVGEQMPVRRKRRQRPWIGVSWAGIAAAAIAAAVLAVGWPGGGSAGPSAADAAIVRHALQAMTAPANVIVHEKETGVQNGTPISVEWWQQTSPPHALRMIKKGVDQQGEAGNDGTTAYEYDAATNTVIETPSSSAPTLVDPIETVRDQLARGGAQVAGKATIDGTAVYKIELPTGAIAYFDTTDYRPTYIDNPQDDGSVVRTRVETYEELSTSPADEQLLSVTAQHPDARVHTRSAPVK
jgi:hypothetical protein